jgi:hypothetical protein
VSHKIAEARSKAFLTGIIEMSLPRKKITLCFASAASIEATTASGRSPDSRTFSICAPMRPASGRISMSADVDWDCWAVDTEASLSGVGDGDAHRAISRRLLSILYKNDIQYGILPNSSEAVAKLSVTIHHRGVVAAHMRGEAVR